MVAPIGDSGPLGPARQVAGGLEESVQQPQWGPGGELYFVTDVSGYWNLYMEEAEGKVGGSWNHYLQARAGGEWATMCGSEGEEGRLGRRRG